MEPRQPQNQSLRLSRYHALLAYRLSCAARGLLLSRRLSCSDCPADRRLLSRISAHWARQARPSHSLYPSAAVVCAVWGVSEWVQSQECRLASCWQSHWTERRKWQLRKILPNQHKEFPWACFWHIYLIERHVCHQWHCICRHAYCVHGLSRYQRLLKGNKLPLLQTTLRW